MNLVHRQLQGALIHLNLFYQTLDAVVDLDHLEWSIPNTFSDYCILEQSKVNDVFIMYIHELPYLLISDVVDHQMAVAGDYEVVIAFKSPDLDDISDVHGR